MAEQDDVTKRTGRRELVVLLLAGAAGSGLVLLASRQQVGRVIVTAPHPLPVTSTLVSAQELLPAASALAIAALASMAAVLATRGLLRRITGLVTAALGVGAVFSAAASLKVADVLAAARHANISPANGGGGAISPGSTTAGAGGGQASGPLAGFPAHVVLAGSAWRVMMLGGAALVIVAGCAIVMLARRLPAMSSRYERTAAPSGAVPPAGPVTTRDAPVAASMWDSLSVGADPTAMPGDEGPG
jgi:uncharacterized membrane protein (TIGR02234 family)